VPTSRLAEIMKDGIRLTVTPSDHTSEEYQQRRSRHTSRARVGRLWTRIWLGPSYDAAIVSAVGRSWSSKYSPFPKSPTLTTGEGPLMPDRKTFLGLIANRLAMYALLIRGGKLTSMHSVILQFHEC